MTRVREPDERRMRAAYERSEKRKARGRARNRAVFRLARLNLDQFTEIYREELEKEEILTPEDVQGLIERMRMEQDFQDDLGLSG